MENYDFKYKVTRFARDNNAVSMQVTEGGTSTIYIFYIIRSVISGHLAYFFLLTCATPSRLPYLMHLK